MSYQDDKRRSNPCSFNEGINKDQFEILVEIAAEQIDEITSITINESFVIGTVRTNC